jgi:hypothetical protein
MAGLGPYGGVSQEDKEAFARAVMAVLTETGDIAAEVTWQRLSQVITQYWVVFQTDQSPLSTWGMLAKCTDTVLRIRAFSKAAKGESGQDALAEFRSFMGEVLGDVTKKPAG